MIGINRTGLGDGIEYNGKSIFVSPNGEILNEIDTGEMLIINDLKIEKIKEVKERIDIKKDRREELYAFR